MWSAIRNRHARSWWNAPTSFTKRRWSKDALDPIAGNGLFANEGDFWRRQRKLAQPAFHHARIEAYGTTMVQQTVELLAGWSWVKNVILPKK